MHEKSEIIISNSACKSLARPAKIPQIKCYPVYSSHKSWMEFKWYPVWNRHIALILELLQVEALFGNGLTTLVVRHNLLKSIHD